MKKNVFAAASMVGLAMMGLLFGNCSGNAAAKADGVDSTNVAVKKTVAAKSIGSLEDSLSYAYGVGLADNLRENFEQMPVEINMKLFMKAFSMTLNGEESKLKIKPEQAYQIFQHCMMAVMERQAQNNKKAAAEFMAENAKKEGVKTTASGLQYEVITEGQGATPTAADRVSVHYHGTLLDGSVFDSSVDRGTPAQFGVSQVIPGWQEGLQLMKVGSKYKFYIPSDLAYGDQGAGDVIAPGSMLIFEVELLDIINN